MCFRQVSVRKRRRGARGRNKPKIVAHECEILSYNWVVMNP
jgi:hypothetical protein